MRSTSCGAGWTAGPRLPESRPEVQERCAPGWFFCFSRPVPFDSVERMKRQPQAGNRRRATGRRRRNAWTAEDLIRFETEIADIFNQGRIRAPVHLASGNEKALIRIFRDVKPRDWVMCSWRSHYHCLLKGVPTERVRAEILSGRSISLCFPEYHIVSSAIVGGIVPIALGVALGIRRRGGRERVHCFLGDMAAETGIAHECMKYARNHRLPIRFIVEDNGLSVRTDTRAAWNQQVLSHERARGPSVVHYRYRSKYPHAGAGVRVQF